MIPRARAPIWILLPLLTWVACHGSSSNHDGATGTDSSAPEGGVGAATVGAAGGEVVSADGRLTLSIPAGALAAEVAVSIERREASYPGVVGGAYEIGPSGTVFAIPVELRLEVPLAELGTRSPEGLELATLEGAKWLAIEPSFRSVTASKIEASALIQHLSLYSISYVWDAPHPGCGECARADWDNCCASPAADCYTHGPGVWFGLKEGACVMFARSNNRILTDIDGFETCYGAAGHSIGPCSNCQVNCALAGRVGGRPLTMIGWRTPETPWSTADFCTAIETTREGEPSRARGVMRCFQECARRGQGQVCFPPTCPCDKSPSCEVTCGCDSDCSPADGGAPPDGASAADAGSTDATTPDARPADARTPDAFSGPTTCTQVNFCRGNMTGFGDAGTLQLTCSDGVIRNISCSAGANGRFDCSCDGRPSQSTTGLLCPTMNTFTLEANIANLCGLDCAALNCAAGNCCGVRTDPPRNYVCCPQNVCPANYTCP